MGNVSQQLIVLGIYHQAMQIVASQNRRYRQNDPALWLEHYQCQNHSWQTSACFMKRPECVTRRFSPCIYLSHICKMYPPEMTNVLSAYCFHHSSVHLVLYKSLLMLTKNANGTLLCLCSIWPHIFESILCSSLCYWSEFGLSRQLASPLSRLSSLLSFDSSSGSPFDHQCF